MSTVAIIQARMGSERLAGKVLMEVNGKPLIVWLIERVKRAKNINKIILATPNDPPLIEIAKQQGISHFKGSEDDVLSRYYHAALKYEVKTVVRITGDCPLIDPEVIDQVIDYYHQNTFDYVSNTLIRTYPRGMDTEVFSFDALQKAFHEATTPYQREHVTAYLYQNRLKFKCGNVALDPPHAEYRLTVDTEEDFMLIKKILERFENSLFSLEDVIFILQQNPEWKKINAHIQQKN